MKLSITPAQVERVNALIRSTCCNCIKDRCLLLGGGRDSPCIQRCASPASTAAISGKRYCRLKKNCMKKSEIKMKEVN